MHICQTFVKSLALEPAKIKPLYLSFQSNTGALLAEVYLTRVTNEGII